MCGIFGILSFRNHNSAIKNNHSSIIEKVIRGLEKLEYRGYDSAGIGFITSNSGDRRLNILKRAGKIKALKDSCAQNVSRETFDTAKICIGHTRWATHGEPSETNAHPIRSAKNFAVVMNGIIENFEFLKADLEARGVKFKTDTDTEVVAALIQYHYDESKDLSYALKKSFDTLAGSFAYIVISDLTDEIYCCCSGAPMIIGKSDTCIYISSDSIALSEYADEVHNLSDGIIISINGSGEIETLLQENSVNSNDVIKFDRISQSTYDYDKGSFPHFMLKEIHESSTVIQRILNSHAKDTNNLIPTLSEEIFDADEIVIVGCGTSYNAGFAIKYILQQQFGIRCSVHIASELRHQPLLCSHNTLFIFISQSGETADTLGALEHVKKHNFKTLSFVNVLHSTIAKKSDHVIDIMAGPEIGVASTKAFIAQYACLLLFALRFGVSRETFSSIQVANILDELRHAEEVIPKFLDDQNIVRISEELTNSSLILFIGRGISYPLSLEGALKFKEITYKMSEGLPAGELKHGPIALIDRNVWVVSTCPDNELCKKTISNMHEVKSRKANVLMLSTANQISNCKKIIDASIQIPECSDFVAPVIYAIPMQLISYYAARHLDLEIDQPRNLAKSVTVE